MSDLLTYPTVDGGTLTPADFNLDDTWHLSKLTCSKTAWYWHMVFTYTTFLAGLGAMSSRMVPRFKWTHVWFGRVYIIAMLCNTFTSLMIHNTGLPINTIILFVVIMIAIGIGWPIIMVHQNQMNSAALKAVGEELETGHKTEKSQNLEAMLQSKKAEIAGAKSFWERMLSIKALHGWLMFISWGNIAARVFASNQSGDFECYTHPVYKPLQTFNANTKTYDLFNKTLQLVPIEDPRYARLPWATIGEFGFSAIVVFAWTATAVVVGSIVAFYESRKRVHTNADNKSDEIILS